MFLPGGFDQLSQRIIEILLESSSLSVPAIDRLLVERCGSGASPATVYRRIAALHESQVLVRHRRRYALSPMWVGEIQRCARQLEADYGLRMKVFLDLPAREGQLREYAAPSLRQLDPLWNSVLVAIARQPGEDAIIGYNAHAWYALGMTDTERRLYRNLVAAGCVPRLLYGSRSRLDAYGAELITVSGFEGRTGGCSAFPAEGYAVWASRHYTVECLLPPEISRRFAVFFARGCAPEELDLPAFEGIFSLRADCRIRVRRCLRRAQAARAALDSCFAAA